MINIKFPDGSVRQYESGVTPLQVAESISPRFAADVLAAKVNGKEWDIARPIATDADIQLFSSSGMTLKANMLSGILQRTFLRKLFRNYIPE